MFKIKWVQVQNSWNPTSFTYTWPLDFNDPHYRICGPINPLLFWETTAFSPFCINTEELNNTSSFLQAFSFLAGLFDEQGTFISNKIVPPHPRHATVLNI